MTSTGGGVGSRRTWGLEDLADCEGLRAGAFPKTYACTRANRELEWAKQYAAAVGFFVTESARAWNYYSDLFSTGVTRYKYSSFDVLAVQI